MDQVYYGHFYLGQTVYLVTDPEQHPRIVLYANFHLSGGTVYGLGFGETDSYHAAAEISTEKDLNKKLGLEQKGK